MHDWLVGRRGGELVLDAIADALTGAGWEIAGVWTMYDRGASITPALDRLARHGSPMSRLPGVARRWALPVYPWAVGWIGRAIAREHARGGLAAVVSSSSAAVKGVRAPGGVPHVCYCHTPARYLWDRGGEYARSSLARAAGLAVCGGVLRSWDRRTAAHVDAFLANSRHTAGLIERCYGRGSVVVHPPVRTGFFTPGPGVAREDFWVCAGALEPYKRVDAVIRAAARAGRRLVVVGDGSERARLAVTAGRAAQRSARGFGVEFRRRAGDDELRDLFRRARCLVHPQVEDFGITAVEAQACGCPVLARRAGGALDTVADGVTGVFFDEPTPEAIGAGEARLVGEGLGGSACVEQAARFGGARFAAEFLGEFARAVGGK